MPFQDLPDRLREVQQRIDEACRRGGHGQAVTIVAVTKTHGPDAVSAAWAAGVRDVGENRIQEALPKQEATNLPVRWHLIGHLQRNKVKSLPHFDLVHSVDSQRLADAISDFGVATGRRVPSLIQVNIAGEETKGGFAPDELPALADRLHTMHGLDVQGVMTMAPFDAGEATLRRVFGGARAARDVLSAAGHAVPHLSMGMSGDYDIAIEEGATLVRLGTILFGSRSA
jgi:PLP dependent protein